MKYPILLEKWNGVKVDNRTIYEMIVDTIQEAIRRRRSFYEATGDTLVLASYEKGGIVEVYVTEIKENGVYKVKGLGEEENE